ncbi:MAG: NADH-quinone oxidoreductase subunit L [Planctomycetota bacterium]|nr:NADH-quinone oxidoreductase subunit L [Planctomycetota bacterium]
MDNWIFLIPLLPFLGFLVNGLLGRRLGDRTVAIIGCASVAGAFAVAVASFLQVYDAKPGTFLAQELWTWIQAGDLRVSFGLVIDPLSGIMCLVVTGVGSLIHVYSTGYMKGDSGYARFFAYLNLFMASMLILVTADNIVLMFLGWEGVGLCSYLLIGFWYKGLANCSAGIKAFVVNRIGDLGFLLGIFAIWAAFGSFEFSAIVAKAAELDSSAAFWICLLLFVGACGKSAQIPLYVWLPDAMAGPTPVSALIHAATMVTSGVYLLARLGPLFDAAPGVLTIVATIGALTALLAALIAFSQNDIKKVLAYSTVSQLGYMFLAAGMGAYSVAIFHVVTHAFFKALLFLGAGAVIHSLHHEQDMRRMGGLRRRLPWTFALYLIGGLALSGFPLTAGFFSKDEILHVAHSGFGNIGPRGVLWAIGLLTALLTAFYTFRQIALVFFGSYRGASEPQASEESAAHGLELDKVKESPLSMRIPLIVLAALSLAGGFLAIPHVLQPGIEIPEDGKLSGLIIGGIVSIAGIAAALSIYLRLPGALKGFLSSAPGKLAHRLSSRKFYVDEIYQKLIIRPIGVMAEICFYVVDRLIIDILLVHGSGFGASALGHLLRRLQDGRTPTYAAWFLAGAILVLAVTLWAAGG